MVLPLIKNLEVFKEMNVRDDYNVSKGPNASENYLKASLEDQKFICRNLKFRFFKAGECIFRYKEIGTELFILLKGKASVIVPKKKAIPLESNEPPL